MSNIQDADDDGSNTVGTKTSLIPATMASLLRSSARIARSTPVRSLHTTAVRADHFLNADVEVGDKPDGMVADGC